MNSGVNILTISEDKEPLTTCIPLLQLGKTFLSDTREI